MYSYNKEEVVKESNLFDNKRTYSRIVWGIVGASKGNVATWEKGISLPNASRLRETLI